MKKYFAIVALAALASFGITFTLQSCGNSSSTADTLSSASAPTDSVAKPGTAGTAASATALSRLPGGARFHWHGYDLFADSGELPFLQITSRHYIPEQVMAIHLDQFKAPFMSAIMVYDPYDTEKQFAVGARAGEADTYIVWKCEFKEDRLISMAKCEIVEERLGEDDVNVLFEKIEKIREYTEKYNFDYNGQGALTAIRHNGNLLVDTSNAAIVEGSLVHKDNFWTSDLHGGQFQIKFTIKNPDGTSSTLLYDEESFLQPADPA